MVFGLAPGILSTLLLLTYVFNELSHDKYLPDANRVYRIASDYHGNSGTQQTYYVVNTRLRNFAYHIDVSW